MRIKINKSSYITEKLYKYSHLKEKRKNTPRTAII